MRFRFGLLLILICAPAFAVAPQFWRVTTVDDFLAGEIEGLAVTSRGELRAAPGVRKVASFADPFVLSQVTSPNGDRFFGTGNDGKIYRLRGSEVKLLYTASEPEIYALAFHDGALYAGSSPNGKVYRIDPDSGSASAFYDPKQAYIWALLPVGNGDLVVATGVEGKLFRVSAKGEGKLLFDAPETHIRSLAARKDGTLLAGGSGKGRIYQVKPDGSAHALHDGSLNEISAIHVDANGVAWAAGASNVLPTSAPPKQAKPQQQQQGGSSGSSSSTSGQEQKKDGEQSPKVEVSFSFDAPSSGSDAGSAELYRIHSDGFVEVVRKFEREMIYAIASNPNGGIFLATGPQGRIYSYKDREVALVGTMPEKQVVSIWSGNPATYVTTTNSGAVYRLEGAPGANAEFRSAVKDVERFSRFGQYRIEGNRLDEGTVAIAFRSGNTRTPDSTWSAWTTPATKLEGSVGAPPARYLQWKLSLLEPAADVAVDGVSVAFVNRNVAPVIESVSVQEPAVIFITSAYPASPQVVEATNPDEFGIFTSLDQPRDKEQQGKRAFRKGYRTITWRARDENGDALRYSVSFRLKGSERWLRLRENLDETQLNFDTSQLPDGTYQLRLVATDAHDNPEIPLTDTKDGIEFQVDNSSPSISVVEQGEDVVIRVSDKLATVGKVEYSADAQKWLRLTPADGIADSREETYRLKRSSVAGRFVIVRAVDTFYNVATSSITLQ